MKAFLQRFICRALIVSIAALPFSTAAQAALIGTEEIAAGAPASSGRDTVRNFLSRGEVQDQLTALGLSAAGASGRVDALTDDEVQQLAGRIDSLPAGAHGAAGLAVSVVLVVLIVLLIVLIAKR